MFTSEEPFSNDMHLWWTVTPLRSYACDNFDDQEHLSMNQSCEEKEWNTYNNNTT